MWFLVQLRIKEQRSAKTCSKYMYPFQPQYSHTSSPGWSSYISLKNKLREFGRISKHFLLGDYFINSHNHFPWQHMNIVRRKLMLVCDYWGLKGYPHMQPRHKYMYINSKMSPWKLSRVSYINNKYRPIIFDQKKQARHMVIGVPRYCWAP